MLPQALIAYEDELMRVITPNINKAGGTIFLYAPKTSDDLLLVDYGLGVRLQNVGSSGCESETVSRYSETDLEILRFIRHRIPKGKRIFCFLTHGHLDHVGGVAELAREFNVVFYGTAMTQAMMKRAIQKRNPDGSVTVPEVEFHLIGEFGRLELGPFIVDYFPTVHSIPETRSLVVRTVDGWKGLHMAEFRVRECSLAHREMRGNLRLSRAMFAGIRKGAEDGPYRVVFIDALRNENGYSRPEQVIEQPLRLILEHPDFPEEGAVILPFISSKVWNLAICQEVANAYGCRVQPAGRAMRDMLTYARERGWVANQAPAPTGERRYKRLIIPCTGSQNEPGAALPRAIDNTARDISLLPNDWVMLAQSVIPQYRESVRSLMREVLRRCHRLVIGRGDCRYLGFRETDSKILIIDDLIGARFETTSGHGRLADQHDVRVAAPCVNGHYINYQSEDDLGPSEALDEISGPPVSSQAVLAEMRQQLLEIYPS